MHLFQVAEHRADIDPFFRLSKGSMPVIDCDAGKGEACVCVSEESSGMQLPRECRFQRDASQLLPPLQAVGQKG